MSASSGSSGAPGGPAAGSRRGAARRARNRAIARGVKHLRDKQGKDGLWLGDETRYPGGLTAFVAYTLQKSGVKRGAPEIAAALRGLADVPHRST